MIRTPSKRALSALAVTTALLGLSCSAVAASASTVPTAVTATPFADSGPGFTVADAAGGYLVTVTLPTQLPVVDDIPVLVADGKIIGPATQSADGLSLSVTTPDPAVLTAKSIDWAWSTGGGGNATLTLRQPTAAQRALAADTPHAVTPGTGPALTGDPALAGPIGHKDAVYNFGAQAIPLADIGGIRGEVEGKIYLPTNGGPHPLAIFLHGRHSSCYSATTLKSVSGWPCPTGSLEIPSYLGYDGAGDALASHGIEVVSIGADAINSNDNQLAPDDGAVARGQLILDTLTWLQKADTDPSAGSDVTFYDANKAQTVSLAGALAGSAISPADLFGSMDFSDIGVMGHSRGGEGAATAVSLNAGLAHPFAIKSAFLLAPIDFTRDTVPGVITTTLLPYCDGDVSDQQGQHFYADSRNDRFADNVQRSDILVMGTDHDFYNSVWTPPYPVAADDWNGSATEPSDDPVCGQNSGTSTRLSAAQQFQVGSSYLAGFFEDTLGGTTTWQSMFDGSNALPSTVSSYADVRDITNQPASSRDTVQSFASPSPLVSITGGAAAATCASRDARTTTQTFQACTTGLGSSAAQPYWTPAAYAGNVPLNPSEYLTWPASTSPATQYKMSVTLPSGSRDVSKYGELTVAASPDESVASSDDMTITVTDGVGKSYTTPLSTLNKWTVTRMPGSTSSVLGGCAPTSAPTATNPTPAPACTNPPVKGTGKLILQQAHLPTSALSAAGLTLTNIASVSFTVIDPTTSGGEFFQDLQFDSKAYGTPTDTTYDAVDVAPVNVEEGNTSDTRKVAVYLSSPATSTTTAYFSLVGSTTTGATLPPAEQSVTFAAGDSCKVVEVPILGNTTPGTTASTIFHVGVSVPSGAVLGSSEVANLTVREDDGTVGTTTTTGGVTTTTPAPAPLPPFGVEGDPCAEHAALATPGVLTVTPAGPVTAGTTQVTATGSGYRSGESVALSIGGVATASAIADSTGKVTIVGTVPAAAPAGAQTFSAVGAGSGYTTTATATVTGGAAAALPEAPYAVMLPLVAMLFALLLLFGWRRRRASVV